MLIKSHKFLFLVPIDDRSYMFLDWWALFLFSQFIIKRFDVTKYQPECLK